MNLLDNAHALVAGIADYQHLRKLPAVEDAADIARLLADPTYCGYPSDNVDLLLDGPAMARSPDLRAAVATGSAIRAGLERLVRRAGPKSTVFIYFSGHGGQLKEGPAKGQYLLPVDAVYPTDQDLARTSLSGAEFTQALNAIKAQRLTVVLDCCHAGGIGEPRDLVAATRVEPGLSDGYLDALKAGSGRVIIAATRASDPAYVRPGARYGVFTRHFLEGLRGAARGDGGVIRILDLYSYVQQSVVAEQPSQRPVLKVELEENYPIALYGGGTPPVPPPAEKPTDGFQYDVYVNYCRKEPDRNWVEGTLLPRLKAEGLRIFADRYELEAGVPPQVGTEMGVTRSRYVVGVFTPHYLESGFNVLEKILDGVGVQQSQQRFLGVMIDSCKPKIHTRARYFLDMTDPKEFDSAMARLIAQIREAPDREQVRG